MSDKSVMSARQSAELDHALERHGWTAADVKWLSTGDALAQVLLVRLGTHQIVPIPLLTTVATFDLPATTTPFVVSDHFRVDTSDTAQVKIAYLGDNFMSWCLAKIEAPVAQMSLRASVLQRNSLDPAIIHSLGGEEKVETTFSTVWALMVNQGQGQAGRLLTNGYANIFYVRDVQSVLRAVFVYWVGGGWNVCASPVEDPLEWRVGLLVFSRNS